MRTIKASEVRKGMRVRVEESLGSRTTQVTEGPVLCVDLGYSDEVGLTLDGTTFGLDPDHPVTVLAEPEPEWVEGAWYRCRIGENEPENLRRLSHGWTPFHDTERVYHVDDDPDITVLGRVLIVDWPGDEHASKLVETYGAGLTWDDFECSPLQTVADAIRTQGGVR